jgi:tetratricopeptide (TPR) repeat protein
LALVVVAQALVSGCSRSKNTWLSRNWHMLSSKYNPLFNGNEALRKGVEGLEGAYQDNYLELLPIYIWPTEADVARLDPDMERAEEKGVKTIKEHSMVFGRDQKNKYIDDSYLLIGKARFYRRYWFPALEAFNYVIVEFPKGDVVHEARLWAARTYVQVGNYAGAQEQFDKLYRNPRVAKSLQKEAVLSMAEMEIKKKNYERAIELIEESKKLNLKKERKVRLTYIQAQLYELLGKDYEAAETYQKVVKMKPPYDFYFAAVMARVRNFNPLLEKSEPVYSDLRKMLKSDKNRDNRDQIYYAMADIAIKEDHIPEAMDYLARSIRTNTVNTTQLGLSHLRKGELHFEFREYVPAAGHYDTAYQSLPKEHPRYEEVKKKNESLGELVKHLRTIEEEDSLQALAALPEKERDKIIKKHIRELERKKEEEARAQEARTMMAGGQGGTLGGGMAGGQRSGKWYFYDDNQRNTGVAEFSNRWGSRKLEDNWRRKVKTSISDFTPGAEENDPEEELDSLKNPLHPAYYIARLPLEPDSLEASHQRIIKAHQGAELVYREVLEDLKEAVGILEQLLKRYPKAEFEPRTLYTLCLLTRETKQAEKNDNYCGKLQSEYGHTAFAQLLDGSLDPDADSQHDAEAEKFYRDAYALYNKGAYSLALQKCEKGILEYANTELQPKLELLKALCVGGQGKVERFVEHLQIVAEKYKNTTVGAEADEILAYLNATVNASPELQRAESMFSDNRNEAFQYVLIIPRRGADFNRIRNSISDFNMQEFSGERLTSKNILMGTSYQLVIISGFSNAQKALNYFEKIDGRIEIAQYLPPNYKHFVISQSNFQVMYKEEAVDEYQTFFNVRFASQ